MGHPLPQGGEGWLTTGRLGSAYLVLTCGSKRSCSFGVGMAGLQPRRRKQATRRALAPEAALLQGLKAPLIVLRRIGGAEAPPFQEAD